MIRIPSLAPFLHPRQNASTLSSYCVRWSRYCVVSTNTPAVQPTMGGILYSFASLAKPKGNYGLTNRELQVLEAMTQGLGKKEIADRLSVSYHTVDAHTRNIYAKLHVHSYTGAVSRAFKERLF